MKSLKKKMLVRLNKFLADAGVASRRKSEEYILQGRVTVNDKVVTEPGTKINTEKDAVLVDNEKVSHRKHIYLLLNKPKGVVTTTSDEKKRKTVLDLIKTKERIYPVGRLDYNTTGVLLLTNDGDFANFLTHPKNKITRTYVARLDKPLAKEDKERLLKGIILDKRKSLFKNISFPIKNNYKVVSVDVVEGRNHFVKRMFFALGYKVVELQRTNFGGFQLKNLKPGQYRKLSPSEIQKIIEADE